MFLPEKLSPLPLKKFQSPSKKLSYLLYVLSILSLFPLHLQHNASHLLTVSTQYNQGKIIIK